jgi:hypothetical protein
MEKTEENNKGDSNIDSAWKAVNAPIDVPLEYTSNYLQIFETSNGSRTIFKFLDPWKLESTM